MNNLKPCPHCDSAVSERIIDVYTIICPNCGVRMLEPLGYEEHARKRWNNRAERYRKAEARKIIVVNEDGEVLAAIMKDKIIEKNGVSVIIDWD